MTSTLTPTNTPIATLTPTNTCTPTITPTATATNTFTPTNTPTNNPSLTQTPTLTTTQTPIPSHTPTAIPPTNTPGPQEDTGPTPTPAPTNTPSISPEPEKETSADIGGLSQGIAEISQEEPTSSENNDNILVKGIRESFGFILGAISSLPNTGDDDNSSDTKLPSGNSPKEKTSLSISKIGIEEAPIYQASILGDQLLTGDDEILELNQNIFYGHNNPENLGLIRKLDKGDIVIKTEGDQVLKYQVFSVARVSQTRIENLEIENGQMVLITCDFWDPSLRLIVKAVLEK